MRAFLTNKLALSRAVIKSNTSTTVRPTYRLPFPSQNLKQQKIPNPDTPGSPPFLLTHRKFKSSSMLTATFSSSVFLSLCIAYVSMHFPSVFDEGKHVSPKHQNFPIVTLNQLTTTHSILLFSCIVCLLFFLNLPIAKYFRSNAPPSPSWRNRHPYLTHQNVTIILPTAKSHPLLAINMHVLVCAPAAYFL